MPPVLLAQVLGGEGGREHGVGRLGPCLPSLALDVVSADAGCWFLLGHHRAFCILHPVTFGAWLETKRLYLGWGDRDGKCMRLCRPQPSPSTGLQPAVCLGPGAFPRSPSQLMGHLPWQPKWGTPDLIPASCTSGTSPATAYASRSRARIHLTASQE